MIDNLTIKEVATYNETGIRIGLSRINYIFGSNGTGKTTISEFLRNSNKPDFSSCKIEWKHSSSDFEIFVYNRHFVNENFNVRNEIKGIFTLGKESSDLLKMIDGKNKEIEKHRDRIEKLDYNIKQREEQIKNLQDSFMDQCWALKQKYDNAFSEAFSGLRNNKKRFTERFLEEVKNNNNELYTFDELKTRVDSVLRSSREKIMSIPKIQYDISLEDQPIFKKKIIGKGDLDIAKLITDLNISDWVRQGHRHMKKTDGICPFCQQDLPVKFNEKLDEYFDETYTEQLQKLELAIDKYENETKQFLENYIFIVTEDIPYINKEKVASLFELMNSKYNENIQLLENKIKEPSRSIELNSIKDYIEQINYEINQANIKISEFNRVIDNIKVEEKLLIKDIWRFVIEENKENYNIYNKNIDSENKALKGMMINKRNQEEHKRKFEEEVTELQKELTSVLPSIKEINKLLRSFGFTNFELSESDEEGYYKIVRENGEDANETLSEGEKTFITFLYFYQLINGSNNQSKVNTPRIVVIDDPISSLDSNVLFIVSNLINILKERIRKGDTIFRQLIILTHNIYFHKEASFNKGHGSKKLGDETFWILRKENNTSFITEYTENPIKNSYELLWRELKENQNSITIPNIMRRILENYFKFFGNIDVEKIIEEFPVEEKVVCNTLLSWSHDGSHHVNDDLYVDSSPDLIKKYFEIFTKIFIFSGHEAHFKMMMGDDFEFDNEENSSEELGKSEIQETLNQIAISSE